MAEEKAKETERVLEEEIKEIVNKELSELTEEEWLKVRAFFVALEEMEEEEEEEGEGTKETPA